MRAPHPAAPPEDPVARAMALFGEHRYREAAPPLLEGAFRDLARGDEGEFTMNALLAAKAWMLAEEPNGAWSVAARVLQELVPTGRARQALPLMHKLVQALRERGYPEVAMGVSNDAGRALGTLWVDPDAPRLPNHCVQCGAAVRPAEVTHPTPTTVACKYCGASLS
jgi:hypothetical protein